VSILGLTNGTAYTFTVTATTAAGTGPASAVSASVQPAPPAPGDAPHYMADSTTTAPPVVNPNVTGNVGADLNYQGGPVVTASPTIYFDFYGSQWGTPATDAQGYMYFPTGDPANQAAILQGFFDGLGTNYEGWSSILTQYCQGVPTNSQSCPPGSVSPPYSKVTIGGVWWDNASPATKTVETQFESENARNHFGIAPDTANAIVMVVTPQGQLPDDVNRQGACAFHGWTHGSVPYIVLPYMTDLGGCGGGVVAGITLVASHEYAELMTDPHADLGWRRTAGTNTEIGDLCNLQPTTVVLGTGTFTVQKLWSNDNYSEYPGQGCANARARTGPVVGLAGRCMDVQHGFTAQGTPLWLYDCNGGPSQTWTAAPDGSLQVFGGNCLDWLGAAVDGAALISVRCSGSPTQQWRAGPGGRIVNQLSRLCVDVTGGNPAIRTPLQLSTCNGSQEQSWRLPAAIPDAPTNVAAFPGNGQVIVTWSAPVGPFEAITITGYTVTAFPGGQTVSTDASASAITVPRLVNGTSYFFTVTANNAAVSGPASVSSLVVAPRTGFVVSQTPSGRCIVPQHGWTDPYTLVWLYDCDGTSAQYWNAAPDGSFRVFGGSCLDVQHGSLAPNGGMNAPVDIYPCNGTPAQQWTLQPDGSLLSALNGLCIDLPGGATAIQTLLRMWTCNGTIAQKWRLN
jgi:hypothetical protein